MKLNLLIILSLVLILPSCVKSELKKPTSVNIEFNIDESIIATNDIKLKESQITIQDFNISGKRIEGENINFTRELNSPLSIDLAGEDTIDELFFNIPQGDYTEITIQFKNSIETENPSFILYGKYKLMSGPTVHVIFEILEEQLFTIECEFGNGAEFITLDKDIEQNISIELNSVNWLNSITNSELENATLTIGNSGDALGNSTILINETNNISLYNKLIENMSNGNKAIFK